jgi:SAM-dependent methyltransferase
MAVRATGRPEYDALAPHYDAFTAASDYETFAVHVLDALREQGLSGHALLDLACGTGRSAAPFAERGFHVTGVDASRPMLDLAARRLPEATLLQEDMRALPALGRFDLVISFDDSLNHLADEDELAAAFAGIARNLRAGGLLAFDLNTLLAYRTTFATHHASERDGALFVWRGAGDADAAPGSSAEAELDVFVSEGDGRWRRVTTRHRQRHFERDRVHALLEAAGLECVAVRGVLADATLTAPADETRQLKVLYTARRAEGGDAQ